MNLLYGYIMHSASNDFKHILNDIILLFFVDLIKKKIHINFT